MKTIFWNVDTQYDFMREDGKLPVPEAESIEPNLERLTAMAKVYGVVVVNTADSHNENSKEFSANPDYVKTFPQHCMAGTAGAEYVPATAPENAYVADWRNKTLDEVAVREHRNIVLTKDVFDVFSPKEGSPHAGRVLEMLQPERAIVYGVATNVCVDFAVEGLLNKGIEVYVVRDAIKGLQGIPEPLEKWEVRGAKMIESADVVKYLIE